MQSSAKTAKEYLEQLSEERKIPVSELRNTLLKHLPKGFHETMSYCMLSYVVPHSMYPPGYHCDPKMPLPFISIASQKKFIVLHHLGLYSDPKLVQWLTAEYPKHSREKLDIGKGCVRFKKTDQIPYKLLGELVSKITPEKWIQFYEENIKK